MRLLPSSPCHILPSGCAGPLQAAQSRLQAAQALGECFPALLCADLHPAVPLVTRGNRRPHQAGAWLSSHQRSDHLPRSTCWPAESSRDICEVRPPETASSWEAPPQERSGGTSWEVHHLASHRGTSCQCGKTHRPWPLRGRYVPFYFSAPHHPWERGNNENTNGLLQEFFPKGTDITDTPEDYIQRKFHELNLRPRKCLDYKTPYEVYFSKVLHLA